jgi:hypothetical protein
VQSFGDEVRVSRTEIAGLWPRIDATGRRIATRCHEQRRLQRPRRYTNRNRQTHSVCAESTATRYLLGARDGLRTKVWIATWAGGTGRCWQHPITGDLRRFIWPSGAETNSVASRREGRVGVGEDSLSSTWKDRRIPSLGFALVPEGRVVRYCERRIS